MKCPDCGSENSDSAKVCTSCGKAIEWWRIRETGKVGRLRSRILSSLDVIPKTHRGKTPAEVVLENGERFSCVLFLEVTDQTTNEYFRPVGLLSMEYEFDERTRRRVIQPDTISSITQSGHRTPIALEQKMYGEEFREIYMGAPFMCKLILNDGSEYLMNRPDWDTEFITLPNGIPNSEIADVVPVRRFEDKRLNEAGRVLPDPNIKYCLFTR